MKKIVCTLLVALFVASLMLIPASALTANVYDPSGFISADELSDLQQTADLIEDYGYFVMFCLPEDIGSYENTRAFGEAMYDEYGTKDNCIVFVHNQQTNLCDFYIKETGYEWFTEVITDKIFDNYNLTETYYLGAKTFYDTVYATLLAASPMLQDTTVAQNEDATDAIAADTTVAVAESTTEFVNLERTLPLVVDNADIFTTEEEAYFLEKCQAFTDEYKMEIAIVTVTDLEGKDEQAYADDFYDYNGYGYGENRDGLLCLYLVGEEGKQKLCLTTHGTAQQQITDDEIEDILLAIKGSVIYEEYKDAFDWYLNMAEEAVKPVPPLFWFLICLAVGLAIGLLITNIMASANKSVRKQATAADYVRQGSLMMTGTNDMFVRTRVKSVPKPKNNSSSSEGGSTHTSSSGRSHGGGSISF